MRKRRKQKLSAALISCFPKIIWYEYMEKQHIAKTNQQKYLKDKNNNLKLKSKSGRGLHVLPRNVKMKNLLPHFTLLTADIIILLMH